MTDQATDLRNLVLRSARASAARTGPAPRLIVVAGGRPGVGATTIAVNLAVALSQQAQRVVLVDVCPDDPRAAQLCGLSAAEGVVDVLAARRDIHEILIRGPAGIQIAPNRPAPRETSRRGEQSQRRLVDQVKLLGRHADLVLFDVGSGPASAVAHYWRESDLVAFVTTPDTAAVMDSYAALKAVHSGRRGQAVHLIVNRAAAPGAARDAHERIDRSCRRFLGAAVQPLPYVPEDEAVAAAAHRSRPFVVSHPTSAATQAIDAIAAHLVSDERYKQQSKPAPPAA